MIGRKFSLRWKYPHRVEVTVLALETDYLLCDVLHRCGFGCALGKMIGGETRYRYDDFATLFQPMAEDAIALPGAR